MADNKEEKLEVEGTIVEALPATQFTVELDNGHRLLAYLSGKMRKKYIRILDRGSSQSEGLTPYEYGPRAHYLAFPQTWIGINITIS